MLPLRISKLSRSSAFVPYHRLGPSVLRHKLEKKIVCFHPKIFDSDRLLWLRIVFYQAKRHWSGLSAFTYKNHCKTIVCLKSKLGSFAFTRKIVRVWCEQFIFCEQRTVRTLFGGPCSFSTTDFDQGRLGSKMLRSKKILYHVIFYPRDPLKGHT